MPSKSRNGWKSVIVEAVIADHAADLGGRAVEGEKIVLEDLDAVEPGGGDRRELLARGRR